MSKIVAKCKVRHSNLGVGTVLAVLPDDEGVLVRFDNKIQNCPAASLTPIQDPFDEIANERNSNPLEAITHFQALAITSANNKWGVFGCFKIDLLPHQLWVCKQAKRHSPCHLMIADDVGLGKTIEAGIILSAFLHEDSNAKRVLILTPASLVQQWNERLSDMFDQHTSIYSSDADSPRGCYWKANDKVVASYNTLCVDHNGRMKRLLEGPAWDLVIVDEAHHLNYDERQGKTLTYMLLERLEAKGLVKNLLLFTGTPHRGKNFGFLALMHLLSPKFDPKVPQIEQLDLLKNYMIRNNKYTVTDLKGNRLFIKPEVSSNTYLYTPEEADFYEHLTKFISEGFLYANKQTHAIGSSVALVLTCMQKLASSSVAAIRSAISNRLGVQRKNLLELENIQKQYEAFQQNTSQDVDSDQAAAWEPIIVEKFNVIQLVADERPVLKELLELADKIKEETKIKTILEDIDTNFTTLQVLFFTEYKATQRLLLEALMKKYGEKSVTFINGDALLNNVHFPNGEVRNVTSSRLNAAEKFNSGDVRFLIATEAAGEGIDLQEHCHVMFHVDLPWNPMRLHQRVGRLNRYGQKEKVIVHSFRNPDTVESKIWDKLNQKIATIDQAFGAVMDEHEDMFNLILGMTPPTLFNNLFGNAPYHGNAEALDKWFNKATAQFGTKDAIQVVQELCGAAMKFDYQEASQILPQVDLPDLRSFFRNCLAINHSRLFEKDGLSAFKTPEKWLEDFRISESYDNLVFDRSRNNNTSIAGIGNAVFDRALQQAVDLSVQTAFCVGIEYPLLIYSIREKHTDEVGEALTSYCGCKVDNEGKLIEVLTDWKLLLYLNKLLPSNLATTPNKQINADLDRLRTLDPTNEILEVINKEFCHQVHPSIALEGILLPG